MNDTKRKKVNPKEPPFIISYVTSVQPFVQMPEATSTKVDIVAKIDTIEKEIAEEQVTTTRQQETSQVDISTPTTQGKGAS